MITLMAGAAAALASTPAYAQGELSSWPAAGDRIGAPPPVVTLRLPEPVRTASAVVIDGCGRTVPGAVVVAATRVSIRLAIDHRDVAAEDHSSAAGAWRVRWRAVGTDGAPAAGDVPFTVGGERRCEQAPRLLRAAHSPGRDSDGASARENPGGDVRTGTRAGASSSASVPLAPLLTVAGLGVVLTFVQLLVRRRGAKSQAARDTVTD